ncbi:MAG: hypothetical protein JG767_556 [Deferribacteraceae bacterium]|jgi:predicted PurR-regulated permease PerM|nr:hypothetical protein [Deferribacteraceae bacterium]
MRTVKIEVSLKQIFLLVFLFLLFVVVNKLKDIVTTFAISILLAYLFDPLIDYLEKKRMGRTFAIVAVFLIFSLILAMVVIFVLPILYSELLTIINNFPKYFQIFATKIETYAKNISPEFDINMLKDFVLGKFDVLSKFLFSFTKNFTSSVYTFVQSFFNFMIIPILVFYFLKDFDVIKDKFFDIFNKNFRNLNVENSFYEFNDIISRYFRGQLLVSVFLGVSYSIVLMIVGVDGGLLIGIVSGVLSFIPYLGFLVGFVSSITMSYLQFGDFLHPLYILIGFTVVQFIESNIVTPRLVGKSLGLHPTAVIFSLMVGGYLLGLGGMIFSLPVAAFIKVYLKRKLLN